MICEAGPNGPVHHLTEALTEYRSNHEEQERRKVQRQRKMQREVLGSG